MWALHGLPTKSPLAKQKVGPWPRNCHVTRSDCVFVGPVSSASALCKPTRHCPKHMIPFSRISIQRTSTNQICETPYLNECKGDPNNTITTSYHILHLQYMNSIWIPMKLPTKSTHPHPLDPLPWRSRLGAPDFSPQISCE